MRRAAALTVLLALIAAPAAAAELVDHRAAGFDNHAAATARCAGDYLWEFDPGDQDPQYVLAVFAGDGDQSPFVWLTGTVGPFVTVRDYPDTLMWTWTPHVVLVTVRCV